MKSSISCIGFYLLCIGSSSVLVLHNSHLFTSVLVVVFSRNSSSLLFFFISLTVIITVWPFDVPTKRILVKQYRVWNLYRTAVLVRASFPVAAIIFSFIRLSTVTLLCDIYYVRGVGASQRGWSYHGIVDTGVSIDSPAPRIWACLSTAVFDAALSSAVTFARDRVR